ncbi:MAG: hypothetical protein Q8M86_05710 [Syntrophales bacterium]|nr:hypothetical protein [Syntrophales bacterium]
MIDRRKLGGYRYLQWGFTGGNAPGGMYGLAGAEHQGKEKPKGDRSIDLTGGETCVPGISIGRFNRVLRASSMIDGYWKVFKITINNRVCICMITMRKLEIRATS